jgi:hypothetical protein
MDHYRSYRMYTKATKAERIIDTVEFFPQHTPVLFVSPTNVAQQAAKDIIQVLRNPKPSTPFAHVGHNQKVALQQLANIFQPYTTKPNNYPVTLPRVPSPMAVSLPRVIIATPPQATNIILVESMPHTTTPTHRYPTRHIISQSQEQDNLVQVLQVAEQQQWPNTVIKPTTFNFQHWAHAIIDPDTGAAMEYQHIIKSSRHKIVWTRSFANELGPLTQGVGGREKGTNTCFYVCQEQIPPGRRGDITYGLICVDY